MAELKSRLNVAAVCHEGGPVSGTLSEQLAVHAMSLDMAVTLESAGKAKSVQTTLGPAPLAVPLSDAMDDVFMLFVKNTSADKTINVVWGSTQSEVLPGGGLLVAAKGGAYETGGSRAAVTITGDSGATVEVLAAGGAV